MTDTAADFGDITVEDVWDADPTIAPEQVTYRFHEMRVYLDALAGRDAPQWDELDEDEQTLALAIGECIVEWIQTHEPDSAVSIARKIHNVQVYISRGAMPRWEELSATLRDGAKRMVQEILNWLDREGQR